MGIAPDGDEVELADLGGHRVAELGPAVAGVDAEERGEAIEVTVAVVVPDVAAAAAHDDRGFVLRAERTHPGEVHPEIALGLLLEGACLTLGRVRGARRCCHPSPPFSSLPVQRYPQARGLTSGIV